MRPSTSGSSGGKTNIVHNALDRHLKTWRRNKLALIWEGEPGDGAPSPTTPWRAGEPVRQRAQEHGRASKGDRVTIYMGRIPELVDRHAGHGQGGRDAHRVVYGGFSTEALADRIEDAESRVLVTADGGWIRGKIGQPQGRSPTRR